MSALAPASMVAASGLDGLIAPALVIIIGLLALALVSALTIRVLGRRRRARSRLDRRLLLARHERRHAAACKREAELARRARETAGDADWDLEALKLRVRQSFDPLLSWWRPREVARARPFVSDAMFERHREQLAQLDKREQSRRIVAPTLDELEIVALDAAPDGTPARVVARIDYSAYSSLVDARNGRLLDGVHGKRRSFREHWTLVPDPAHGWVVGEVAGHSGAAPRSAGALAPRNGARVATAADAMTSRTA